MRPRSERERIEAYLRQRIIGSYNEQKMTQADCFNKLLTCVEDMTDAEFAGQKIHG